MTSIYNRATGIALLSWAFLSGGVVAGSGSATAQTAAPSANSEVTIYCSAIADWCEKMRQAFETKTGIKTLMTVKSAGETLAQLKAEAGNPKADIWWAGGGDQHLQAAELGLTQDYRSPMLAKLHPWAVKQAEQAQWRTVGIYAGTLGIVCNCWADLLKPE